MLSKRLIVINITLCLLSLAFLVCPQESTSGTFLKTYHISVEGESAVMPPEELTDLIESIFSFNVQADRGALFKLGKRWHGKMIVTPEEQLYMCLQTLPGDAVQNELSKLSGNTVYISYQGCGKFSYVCFYN